ncbi:WcaF family extracellular polysaccharide biosynthesis acetyltransferase [Mucisphaera calidilacus]|uniref:Acetyltransferase n=1 Tax=Mucisphaera calidilacus TaxID=2527982 RepID=A0A518C0G7_9BACT|nr:WcaF family extracellular polysaccharide biosynthesis acetyltransferase [Mucisphaera calidilacus]QDU72722.1 Putative acetyltransferase [Mucisphaera calidilacus]
MIDVMIITYNESLNLPHCIGSVRSWASRVFVVDSGSTDGTQEIATEMGAELVHHDWEGYARQKNWGLRSLPFVSDWILILDADEVITEKLRDRILEVARQPTGRVAENGYFINRVTYFMDKPIRHCGYFPSWNMRLLKRGRAFYEDRAVHEHMVVDDPVGYINEPMLHNDRRGLEHFIAKHNRYSTLEAQQLFHEYITHASDDQANLTDETRRRRWLKRNMMHRMPFPWLWRFIYMFFFRLGFLDGRTGFDFCKLIATYDGMVALKFRYIMSQAKQAGFEPAKAMQWSGGTLAVPEGDTLTAPPTMPLPDDEPDPVEGTLRQLPPDPSQDGSHRGPAMQTQPESSPWTFREKVARAAWMLIGKPIFRLTFHNWYGLRAWLLRRFGATVGRRVAIRPSVNIEVPWMLEIQDDATVGDYAILYSLGKITIGRRSIVSQYAHICAGTHDYTNPSFPLLRTPILINEDVWIGADVYIGPGVEVGRLTVVGARSSVYKDLPEGQVCVGNPARAIKERVLR